ncbi:hypothetical protein AAFF_G00214390 [Aldrovandia affinis]|uniref:C-type lectin domain-containing protein n=1 Tax=Aldrovandia affinis TaxID=143900 RepID=A0AAD7RGQ5_9TELE|nr:hypothetical protein AAFF_G00214390 [Aldrovandia affinis]
MSRWWDSAAVLAAMLCTASAALYVLHPEAASFDGALGACLAADGGSLTSMASEEEKDGVLAAVSASLNSSGSFHFWVGLRKPAGSCAQEDVPLRGFAWTAGDSDESAVSRWKKTPVGTCTSERCGLLSLDFAGGRVTDWGWSDSSCSKRHAFVCRSGAAETPPPHLPGDVSPCAAGNAPPCASPRPPSKAPRVHTTSSPAPLPPLSLPPEGQGTPTPSSAPAPGPGPTTNGGIITQIRDGAVDKYNVFVPVLVALLVLVVLVVVVLSVLKCCFRKRANKAPHSNGEGGKPEEPLDLTTNDLDRNETTA